MLGSEELSDAMDFVELQDKSMRKEDLPEQIAEKAWSYNVQLHAALVAYTRDKAQRLVLSGADRKNQRLCEYSTPTTAREDSDAALV